jgi:LmbE family N-acetylglucosaminyl deacetylase
MPVRGQGSVVVPLRTFDAHDLVGGFAGTSPPAQFNLGGLDPDVTVVRPWAQRLAVVVGQAGHANITASLSAAGFTPVVTSADRAGTVLRRVGPVSFLVLGADSFSGDESAEAVRSWHRASPTARVTLVYPAAERSAEVLVRALRAGVSDVIDPDDRPAFENSLRSGMKRAGSTRERVLAIGAHPDDVEIGCAGTLLDHRRRGDRISILTLSRGTVGGDRVQRVAEAAATADAIGAQLLFADLPDTEIDEGVSTIRLIESVVRMLDPTVVYVHSLHDNHQDHRAVSTAARSATRGVRRVFAYQSPSATNDFLPTQFVNVDETVGRKVEILQMFGSQDGRNYLEPELVVAGARYWARHLGANARYAEPYEVIRSVGELRHLASTPTLEMEPVAMMTPPTHLSAVPSAAGLAAPDPAAAGTR